MGIINKLFKRKEKIYNDYSNIASSLIYTSGSNNIIILLVITKEYFNDVIEFLSVSKLESKFIQTSVDEEVIDKETNKPIILSTPIYYLLIGGELSLYIDILNNIDINNIIINNIINILYKNIPYDKHLMGDLNIAGILDKDLFMNDYVNKHIPKQIKYGINNNITFDSIKDIISELPSVFKGSDLLHFMKIRVNKNAIINGYDFIKNYLNSFKNTQELEDKIKIIYDGCLNNITIDNILSLTLPLYMQSLDEDDEIPGDVGTESLDDIFKEKYDTFNPIMGNDNSYVDIDEILEDTEDDE